MFDVDRVRADLVVSAENVEDLMDLGRGSGIIGARWHNWQCDESEGQGNCSHTDHLTTVFCGLLATLNRKSAGNETERCCHVGEPST
jgi:hypothetical protein